VVRSVALATVLLAALAPPLAHAQVNIDQDKTPASIYQSDCAVCHKSVRGLANGRGSSALEGFLAEHYTSSQQEAAALAAYVLAGGGGTGTPAPVRGDNPTADHTTTATDESQTHEGRRAVKPEDEPAGAKPPRRLIEHGKPAKPERTAIVEPGSAHGERKLPPERHGSAATPTQRGRLKHADAPQHVDAPQHADAPPPPPPSPAPAQVAAAPKPAAPPKLDVSPPPPAPSAAPIAPPPESPPAEASPTSRDNIPD
jgi:hypothetical protein